MDCVKKKEKRKKYSKYNRLLLVEERTMTKGPVKSKNCSKLEGGTDAWMGLGVAAAAGLDCETRACEKLSMYMCKLVYCSTSIR